MNITVRLNDGRQFEMTDASYSALTIEEKMNNPEIAGIAIGDSVFAKYALSYVVPTAIISVDPGGGPS